MVTGPNGIKGIEKSIKEQSLKKLKSELTAY